MEKGKVERRFYSITELHQMGYGDRKTIRNHIAIGTFLAINPGGGKWLIDLKEYDEWLRSRKKRKWLTW